jgi:Gpi18-like mannosyltransferase
MEWFIDITVSLTTLAVMGAVLMTCHFFLKEIGLTAPLAAVPALKDQAGMDSAGQKKQNCRILLTVGGLALLTRLGIYILGHMTVMLFHNQTGVLAWFEPTWNKWDALHYLFIAENWYVTVTDKQYLLVFFPLYPVFIKLFHFVIRNYFWSALVVSNLALIVAAFYLYKLTNLDFDEKISFRAVKYLLFFPVSFFLAIPYSESLFIALTMMTLYYIRKDYWFAAGLCGMLAALTRNLGLLLLIPAFIELLVGKRVIPHLLKRNYVQLRSALAGAAYLLLIPVGFGIYLLINKLVTGDWWTFLAYQNHNWQHQFTFFGNTIRECLTNAGTLSTVEPRLRISLWIPQFSLILVTLGLCFYGFSRIRVSYLAYMVAYLLGIISVTFIISGSRYLMGLFPIYILLALITEHKFLDTLMVYVSLMLLSFFTFSYTLGWGLM